MKGRIKEISQGTLGSVGNAEGEPCIVFVYQLIGQLEEEFRIPRGYHWRAGTWVHDSENIRPITAIVDCNPGQEYNICPSPFPVYFSRNFTF